MKIEARVSDIDPKIAQTLELEAIDNRALP